MKRRREALRQMVERRLADFFPGQDLAQAMRYSLLSGGKRLRPILTLSFCQAAGGEAEEALAFACAVEMLHTYSLIHDDLPCMDDDDLRRGRSACHKVYGPCTAILAGDALQAAAFQTALEAPGPWLAAERPAPMEAAALLAQAAGAEGMCLGQYWDTAGTQGRSPSALEAVCEKKTGALIAAACRMGITAAAGRREMDRQRVLEMDAAAGAYGSHLALAFQIRDDMLDVTGREETLGKPIGSDAALGKDTYVTAVGLEACHRLAQRHTQEALEALQAVSWPGGSAPLQDLAQSLLRREC